MKIVGQSQNPALIRDLVEIVEQSEDPTLAWAFLETDGPVEEYQHGFSVKNGWSGVKTEELVVHL